MLHDLGAKDTGICPVRKKLYAECFGMLSHREWYPATGMCVGRSCIRGKCVSLKFSSRRALRSLGVIEFLGCFRRVKGTHWCSGL